MSDHAAFPFLTGTWIVQELKTIGDFISNFIISTDIIM